jgi:cytochrome d ubiquinol oxidase subunit II
MEVFWFTALCLMMTAYAVLDGFDLGAGVVHLCVTKDPKERKLILKSIGPFWDGNEVILLSAGGLLFLCFPKVYASAFSGLYLPLMLVLWLLILRGVSIELRNHFNNILWHKLWDKSFQIGSILLSIVFGAAIGNLVRGVPLGNDGLFFEPLWTNFRTTGETGVLDWFTVLFGLVSCVTFTVHGANYLALKTENPLSEKCHNLSLKASYLLLPLTLLALLATMWVSPGILRNYQSYPLGVILPLGAGLSLLFMILMCQKRKETAAFASSSSFIIFLTLSMAFGLFPNLLQSTSDSNLNLTAYNSITGQVSLDAAIIWWPIGIVLTTGYFSYNFYSFRGKFRLEEES